MTSWPRLFEHKRAGDEPENWLADVARRLNIGSVVHFTPGVPTDADFPETPPDGTLAIPAGTTDLYRREGVDVWALVSGGGGGGGGDPAHLASVGISPAINSDTNLHIATGQETRWVDITNRAGVAIRVRFAIRPNGATPLTLAHYRLFDAVIQAGQHYPHFGAFHLRANDILTCRADGAATFRTDGKGQMGSAHLTPKALLGTTTWQTLHTAAGDEKVYVDATNVTGNPAEGSLAIVPGGGAVSNEHHAFSDLNFGSGAFVTRLEPNAYHLKAGYEVKAICDPANSVAFGLDGYTI